MVAIITLLVVVVMMLAVVRGATIALGSTGLSRESARFQAVSALTGAGFTTTESEQVVQNPDRRHVILILMILGGFGMVTVMSTLVLSFVDVPSDPADVAKRAAVIGGGLLLVWCSTTIPLVDRAVTEVILWLFRVCLKVGASEGLRVVRIGRRHGVYELQLRPGSRMEGRPLAAVEEAYGLSALGVFRSDGTYVGEPGAEVVVEEYDRIVVYGGVDQIGQAASALG